MPDWENLRYFSALARNGTLAGAARTLRVEHATVARRIATLEGELQLKLLDRRGRKIELTPQGRELLTSLGRMQTESEAIERLAAGKRTAISGEVTLSAPPGLGAAMLGLPLAKLRVEHPGLMLQIIAETRQAALERREADLAIRITNSMDCALTSTRLGEVTFRPYAHPAYVAATPEAEWTFIGYDASMDNAPQQLAMNRVARGRQIALRTNSLALQVSLVREGSGVAMLPEFLVAGQPFVAVEEYTIRRSVWLVTHPDMVGSGAVQAVAAVINDDLPKQLDSSNRT